MPLMQPNINVLLEIAADEIVVVFSLSVLMLERKRIKDSPRRTCASSIFLIILLLLSNIICIAV